MKKRYLLFFLMTGILLTDACKKEFSYERGVRRLAVFTLDGAPGGCMGASVLNTELYNTNNGGVGNKASFTFSDNVSGSTIYEATAVSPGVNILFKIVSHDSVNKTINGTFSGTALSGANVIRAIHSGVFYLSYQ